MNATRFLAPLALSSACAFVCASGSKSVIRNEVIYRLEGATVLEVFNLERLWVSSEGVSYLKRRNGRYGEFGGSFEICSNEEYYCLSGGIAAAIPKKFAGQTTWQFAGQSCRATLPLIEGQTVSIKCTSGSWSNELTYSQSLGIVAYTKLVSSMERFNVVGEAGLFAQRPISGAPPMDSP